MIILSSGYRAPTMQEAFLIRDGQLCKNLCKIASQLNPRTFLKIHGEKRKMKEKKNMMEG